MNPQNILRTWIEIDKRAVYHNISEFRKMIKPRVKLMAIIKSNAYGHGLVDFAKLSENKVDWFGVDSIIEGLKLRQNGLKKPILVLGYTLPALLGEAAKNNISLTVSNYEILRAIAALKQKAKFHIKIDTGMHRQGFLLKDLGQVIKIIKKFGLSPEGIYTHLAAAKDPLYPRYSLEQLEEFKKADELLQEDKKNYLRHTCATSGTMIYPDYIFDMARIGIGLYGIFPSKEVELQTNIKLKPALTWKSLISEIKNIPPGSYIGYDLAEKTFHESRIAIVPIGYWHGFSRGLSSIGEVLVKSKRCKVLGKVSMDMITIDITDAGSIKTGDEVVIIGKQGGEKITAEDMALKTGTTAYEIITRFNPLIHRFYI